MSFFICELCLLEATSNVNINQVWLISIFILIQSTLQINLQEEIHTHKLLTERDCFDKLVTIYFTVDRLKKYDLYVVFQSGTEASTVSVKRWEAVRCIYWDLVFLFFF